MRHETSVASMPVEAELSAVRLVSPATHTYFVAFLCMVCIGLAAMAVSAALSQCVPSCHCPH
eukprot:1151493-Pelagomonas_calceolata.AAC.6